MNPEKFENLFWQCLATFVFVGLAYFLVMMLTASGRFDFCYINVGQAQSVGQFFLYQHVSWRPDRGLGGYETVEQAKAAADLLGCPLK